MNLFISSSVISNEPDLTRVIKQYKLNIDDIISPERLFISPNLFNNFSDVIIPIKFVRSPYSVIQLINVFVNILSNNFENPFL